MLLNYLMTFHSQLSSIVDFPSLFCLPVNFYSFSLRPLSHICLLFFSNSSFTKSICFLASHSCPIGRTPVCGLVINFLSLFSEIPFIFMILYYKIFEGFRERRWGGVSGMVGADPSITTSSPRNTGQSPHQDGSPVSHL